MYGFCGNDGVNNVDYFGFDPIVLPTYTVTAGAEAGSAFGPVGTVVGGIIGGVVGLAAEIFGFGGLFGGGHAVVHKTPDHRISNQSTRASSTHDTYQPQPGQHVKISEKWYTVDSSGNLVADNSLGLPNNGWLTPQTSGEWSNELVTLDRYEVTASRLPSWLNTAFEFGKGVLKGAAIGLATGVAVTTIAASAPATVPYLAAIGAAGLLYSGYQWAAGGFQITAGGLGEFAGGFAGFGFGARALSGIISAAEGEFTTLYHATSTQSAAAIRANGIDLMAGRPNLDFGQGFYTTTNPAQAARWASRFPDGGEVLEFRIQTAQLSRLRGLSFPSADASWTSFVRANRLGAPLHDFDFVSGPMLGNPRAFLSGAEVTAWGQQTSFHSQVAVNLLNLSLLP